MFFFFDRFIVSPDLYFAVLHMLVDAFCRRIMSPDLYFAVFNMFFVVVCLVFSFARSLLCCFTGHCIVTRQTLGNLYNVMQTMFCSTVNFLCLF